MSVVGDKKPGIQPPSRVLLPGLTLACMVVAIVSSLGAPLISTVASENHVSLADAQWSLTITLLVASVAAPVMGRLGDGPYRRRVFLLSLVAMMVGGVLAALPVPFAPFLVGRGLQGMGLGLTPLAIATAREALPPKHMRAGVAMLSTTTAVGVGLGYPVTGLLAKVGGLHLAYWFGAAVAAVALIVSWRVVPASVRRHQERLDITGAVLLGAALAGLLLVLSEGETWGWGSGRVIELLVAATTVLAVWVWWELRVAQPLVALRLLGERAVLTASVATLLASVGMYLLISPVTTFVQTPQGTGYGLGGSVVIAGLVLVPFSATSYLATRVVPWLVRRASHEAILPLSSGVMLGSMVLFTVARHGIWEIVIVMAIAGVGTGSIFAVMPGYLMRAVPTHETSSAMSFNQILRYVGYSTGGALGAAILQAHIAPGGSFPANSGYSIIGVVACVGWLLTAAASILLPLGRRVPPRPAQRGERTPANAVIPETAIQSAPRCAANDGAGPRDPAAASGVSGWVSNADRTSLAGAALTLIDTAANQVDVTRSNDDGTYSLSAGSEGHYLLICASPSQHPSVEHISLAAGQLWHDVVLRGGRPSRDPRSEQRR